MLSDLHHKGVPAFTLLSFIAIAACSPQENANTSDEVTDGLSAGKPSLIASAEISNASNFRRDNEQVYFSYYDLGLEGMTPVSARSGDTYLPSQHIDVDADGSTDGVIVQLDLEPSEIQLIELIESNELPANLEKKTQAEISYKTGGEWVAHTKTEGFQEYIGGEFKNTTSLSPPPHYTDHSNWIRYEGPGIESDKVGYRIYLDWRNGFDIFGKSSASLALHNIGLDGYDSYHNPQDWGLDILKVGSSLGAGGFASWADNILEPVKNTHSRSALISNNGDIFSSFRITYHDWQRSLNTTNLTADFSMSAGSRLAKVKLKADNELGPIAIGVVKHQNTDFIEGPMDIAGDTFTYIGSWGKQSLNDDHLGMAVIFRKRTFINIADDPSSYIAVLGTPGNEFEYYFVAAWEGEHKNGIATKDEFIHYLNKEVERLSIPSRVRLKTALSKNSKAAELTADDALNWSIALAESELARKTLNYHYEGWDAGRKRPPKFEYDIVGWLPLSYHKLAQASGKDSYSSVLDSVTSSFIEDDGNIKRYKLDSYNIDAVAPGSAVLALYAKNKNEKYKLAADLLRHQLENHPKTSEGAYWHKKKYEHQLWLDGVFMGMPFLAEYSSLFENGASLEEVTNEFELTRKYLRDPDSGLYFHGWDEARKQVWANKETGLSPEFWARGMGWLAMATVDTLDFIPENRPDLRKPILEMINEIAVALENTQDADTGTWWQILDKPNQTANYRESSATAMFSYFYAKALRHGYLDDKYMDTAKRAYKGLINEFVLVHADGHISMTNQCYVAGLGFGRDGSYQYYMSEKVSKNDPKGNFPFILAGIEMHALLSTKEHAN